MLKNSLRSSCGFILASLFSVTYQPSALKRLSHGWDNVPQIYGQNIVGVPLSGKGVYSFPQILKSIGKPKQLGTSLTENINAHA